MTPQQITKFLAEEDAKIKRADELYKRIFPFRFWYHFSPTHFRLRREYAEVVKSFRSWREMVK